MKDERKPIKIRATVYEVLKRKAEREGKTISDVLEEILSGNETTGTIGDEEEKYCVFCGQPSRHSYICQQCYYDPNVVRPAVMGALYADFRIRLLKSTGTNLSLDDFAALIDEETAKAHYVTDEEWQEWQEWLEWRREHERDPLLRETEEWKRWVRQHPISKLRHLGALLFVRDREGRSGLQSVGEIVKGTFPAAYALQQREVSGNANDANRGRVGDAIGHDSSNVGSVEHGRVDEKD